MALAASVLAVAAAATATLVTRGNLADLRGENSALRTQAKALEQSRNDLLAKQEALAARLKAAEDRCSRLESRLPDEARIGELAAEAARRELARAGRTARAPAAGQPNREEIRRATEKGADAITAIREKVAKKEMTPEEGRKAIAAEIQKGMKTVLPAGTVERMEQARKEREKNMTPEQKARADRDRAAFIDGIAEWATIQKQVQDGKITREEAHKMMRERWRKRIEGMRKRREGERKQPEPEPAKEQF